MFCSECGQQMSDKAISCPHCGCATVNRVPNSTTEGVSAPIIPLGYVFGFLIPIVGLVLVIITLTKGSDAQKGHGTAVTIISAVVMLIYIAALSSAK
jgi:hypothetical protein